MTSSGPETVVNRRQAHLLENEKQALHYLPKRLSAMPCLRLNYYGGNVEITVFQRNPRA